MTSGDIFSAFSILFIMLGMLGLAAWAIRRFGLVPGQPRTLGPKKEIKLIDSQMLDARTRLVVVNWRGHDYFLGTGQQGVQVIDKVQEGSARSAFQKELVEETS